MSEEEIEKDTNRISQFLMEFFRFEVEKSKDPTSTAKIIIDVLLNLILHCFESYCTKNSIIDIKEMLNLEIDKIIKKKGHE
jgi:hypothetical protein